MNNIHELRDILPLLAQLASDQKPQWGSMTPQQMVEHLSDSLRASRGIPELPVIVDERRAELGRRFLLGNKPLPHNVDNPLMTNTHTVHCSSLGEAVDALAADIDEFYSFFASNPSAAFAHPFFGVLSFDEWVIFHRKHFTHHSQQFGLLQSDTTEAA